MCWRVIMHSLKCDVRPIIFDGMYNQFIDPFAAPNACNCPPEHKNWIQCPDHGCCILTKRIEPCSQPNCTQTYDIHRYDRRPRPQQIWGVNPIFYGQPDDDWKKWEYLDVAIFGSHGMPQVSDCAKEFIDQLSDLIQKGREIGFKHEQVVKMIAEAKDKRELHDTQHGILCNRQNFNCPINKDISNTEQMVARLRSEGQALSAEFSRLWTEVNVKVVRQLMVTQVEEFFRQRGLT
ncbi:hypothetical protein N0V84_002078 [Fusarium piperis]|uniref:Uncharacterized protein n=1 Tax=Fusarium piperis TaxID=1435070 RepID=A0A9W8WK15_9HYPO|nr:hypothetical protein N0V84_002078 [Fusarium piperis]